MNEALGKRGILVTSLMYIVFPFLMIFKEYPLLQPQDHTIFLVGRIFVILVFLAYFTLALFDRLPAHYPVVFYLVGLTYAVHGQYFQPNYWLAMIELNALFPLFFFLKPRTVFMLYGIGVVTFGGAFLKFSEKFTLTGDLSPALRGDIFIGTIITAVIALFTYNNLIAARIERNRLLQRFVDVGKNFGFIVHDLKGMIAPPAVYATLLERSLEQRSDSKRELGIARQLSEDLGGIKKFVTETMKLIAAEFAGPQGKPESIKISDSIELVQLLLRSKLRTIQVKQKGDFEISGRLENLNRIFINIISNSVDAFEKNINDSSEITISCNDHSVEVTDNSGCQLSNDLLKKLNGNTSAFTTKAQGSGVGTLLIKDYAASMGGSVRFSNGKTGVSVKLVLPKKIIRRELSAPEATSKNPTDKSA